MTKEQMEIANELGWRVTADNDSIYFYQFSPAGEDFGFEVKNEGEVADWVYDVAEDFDIEDHVKMWLEAKDNHVSGVPDICTLVDDAREIEYMLYELARRLACPRCLIVMIKEYKKIKTKEDLDKHYFTPATHLALYDLLCELNAFDFSQQVPHADTFIRNIAKWAENLGADVCLLNDGSYRITCR